MGRPNLQIALDNSSLSSALQSISLAGPIVDIVEAVRYFAFNQEWKLSVVYELYILIN